MRPSRRSTQHRLAQVIDYLALALIHGLLALMIVRLSNRPELDREPLPTDEDRPGA